MMGFGVGEIGLNSDSFGPKVPVVVLPMGKVRI
jgi:hypothetical protein